MRRTRSHAATRVRALLALLALGFVLGGGLLSTAAQQPNAAGLVIHHGDGTLVYAYVQFEEESINGADLITRSGVDAVLAPFGGLGGAVCSLNGEGCPSDNCFCRSYTSPAFYWNYYVLDDGEWRAHPVGPSSRALGDGDVDGWAWTAGDHGLPETSIDEIAAMNVVDELAVDREETPAPVTTGVAPTAREPDERPTSTPVSQAVVVAPGATPEVLAEPVPDDDGRSSYLMFFGMAAVVLLVGGAALVRNRANVS